MYSLGLEFSTQSVKMVAVELKDLDMVYRGSFDYDATFPQYKTRGGVLTDTPAETRHTSPYMLLEALDCAFKKMSEDGLDLTLVQAVKIDGMQHCTIYTDSTLIPRLGKLNTLDNLAEQLGPCFTRKTSPIWEDSSPVEEAAFLACSLNADEGIQGLTGNCAELRFPAAQILKWAKEFPKDYQRTKHIFLLSAFLTSILSGKIAPVDTGDGWGTNLNNVNINRPGWCLPMLSEIDGYLRNHGVPSAIKGKLGEMVHFDTPLGAVSAYFTEKYRLNPKAVVLAGTGDNPAALLGSGFPLVISLGSSYTVSAVMDRTVVAQDSTYNVFGFAGGKTMALSVFTNGGKVHEHFLRRYLAVPSYKKLQKEDWKQYVGNTGNERLSSGEKLMLPYFFDESVPSRKKGIIREGFSSNDALSNIRALHLSQVLSLKVNSKHVSEKDQLCLVGGGARNHLLGQWISDVFNTSVFSFENAEVAAPLGCAVSGAAAVLELSCHEIARRLVKQNEKAVYIPNVKNNKVVGELIQRYKKLQECSGPTDKRCVTGNLKLG